MNFTVENRDGLVIFTFKSQNIDSENSPKLKAELLILCQADINGLILDVSDVEYIDSSGLGALLLAHRQLKEYGTTITLVGVQDVVMSMLNISQLTELFGIASSIEEAIEMYTE
jgi:anti-anti-sigma factor